LTATPAPLEITPPFNLVVIEYGGSDMTTPSSLTETIAGFGGTVLVNATKPMRIYEYVIPVPSRLIVSQWKTEEAIETFVKSDIFESDIRSKLGPDSAIAIYGPASDWDPALPGVWAEPGAPAEVSGGPVYHTTVYDIALPEKLRFAQAAMAVLDLYRRFGGFPTINRKPLKVLEGDWSEKRNLLMTRWPCLEAFEAWFLDEPYQQNVKPRRLEAGRFSVMMFGAGS
jgi:uncharacterized protein (DUF1330 family)